MSDALPDYVHRPLQGPKWIRVIQLHPAPNFDYNLTCRIIHLDREWLTASIDRKRNRFQAVSYAWGKPELRCCLICTSEGEENSAIKITPNVETMLRRFRKPHKSINLWIDAICLNQKDRQEIQEQLPQMGSIYGDAQKTRIWLGDEEHGIAKVFAFFETVAQKSRRYDLMRSDNEESWRAVLQHTLGNSEVGLVQRFFRRPWFSRRWVLQERYQSGNPVFYCNRYRLRARILEIAFRLIEESRHSSIQAIEPMSSHAILHPPDLGQPGVTTTRKVLLQNLWRFHSADCSDPRDRIFALLGLNPAIDAELSAMKYDQDAEDMFRLVSASCIRAGLLFEILRHAAAFGGLKHRVGRSPSWVPDWSHERSLNSDEGMREKCVARLLVSRETAAWAFNGHEPFAKQSDVQSVCAIMLQDRDIVYTIQDVATVHRVLKANHLVLSWEDVCENFRALLEQPELDISMLAPFIAKQLIEHAPAYFWAEMTVISSRIHAILRRVCGPGFVEQVHRSSGQLTEQENLDLDLDQQAGGDLLQAWQELIRKHTLFCTEAFSYAGESFLLIGCTRLLAKSGDFVHVHFPDLNESATNILPPNIVATSRLFSTEYFEHHSIGVANKPDTNKRIMCTKASYPDGPLLLAKVDVERSLSGYYCGFVSVVALTRSGHFEAFKGKTQRQLLGHLQWPSELPDHSKRRTLTQRVTDSLLSHIYIL